MMGQIERGNWILEFREDYSQFFESCNWYTFRFCQIEFENDAHLGGIEVTFIILGVGFRWRWNHTTTEFMAKMIRDVAEIKKQLPP